MRASYCSASRRAAAQNSASAARARARARAAHRHRASTPTRRRRWATRSNGAAVGEAHVAGGSVAKSVNASGSISASAVGAPALDEVRAPRRGGVAGVVPAGEGEQHGRVAQGRLGRASARAPSPVRLPTWHGWPATHAGSSGVRLAAAGCDDVVEPVAVVDVVRALHAGRSRRRPPGWSPASRPGACRSSSRGTSWWASPPPRHRRIAADRAPQVLAELEARRRLGLGRRRAAGDALDDLVGRQRERRRRRRRRTQSTIAARYSSASSGIFLTSREHLRQAVGQARRGCPCRATGCARSRPPRRSARSCRTRRSTPPSGC